MNLFNWHNTMKNKSSKINPDKEQNIAKPNVKPRQGWVEQFQKMASNGDDQLLINDVFEDEVSE